MPTISDRLAALVLAAGEGSRLGGGKLLLPWRGKAVLLHVLDAAAGAEWAGGIVLVTGHDAIRVKHTVEKEFPPGETPFRIIENAAWRDGQASSLRLGIGEIASSDEFRQVQGVMILLGDQPQIRADTLERLAREHILACSRNLSHPATAPVHEGRRGNPAIVSPTLFPAILKLSGDVGARNILAGLGDALLKVPVDDPGVVQDIDTPEDYAALPDDP